MLLGEDAFLRQFSVYFEMCQSKQGVGWHLAGEEDLCRLEEFAAQPQHLVHLTAGQP